jgi:tRNA C32,U32 (ribose-2'-O)-methylase TrmJ
MKKSETIQEARMRLSQEIESVQSLEAFVKHTKELLTLIVAYPPENPEFYRKLKEMQDRHQKPILDKMLLDIISDN